MNITENKLYKWLFKCFIFSVSLLIVSFLSIRSYALTVLTNDMIGSLNGYDPTYNGNQHTPDITVVDPNEGVLTKNKDYTLTYGENLNVGEATIKITGKGNYTGSVTKTFTIEPRIIFEQYVYIPDSYQVYSGTEIKPKVEIVIDEKTLISGIDYDIKYVNNIKPGEATAIITGKGNYTGTVYANFHIGRAEAHLNNVSASKIVYGQSLANSKISGIATDSNGNIIPGTFYFENPYFVPSLNNNNWWDWYYKMIRFISDDNNFEAITYDVDIPIEYWGEPIINNGIINWVESNGKTSAVIQNDGITWLKEDSGGSFAWYGIENPLKADGTRMFEPGSRFWVRWVNKNDSDWDIYYNQLDPAHKAKIDSGKVWIFLIGVTSPDGIEYKEFGMDVPVYIQLGDDWDKEDLNAVFITSGTDQPVPVSYLSSDKITNCPANGAFAKLNLTHFSPYCLYDDYGLYDSRSLGNYSSADTGDKLNLNLVIPLFSPMISFSLLYLKKKFSDHVTR